MEYMMSEEKIINDNIPVLVSFSGGKDSTAVALYVLYETNIPRCQVHIIFADTGWEHHYTYWQVLKMSEVHPVQIVRSKKYPNGMPQLMRDRGIPLQNKRFCTQELKIYPVREYQQQFKEYVSVKGIRKEEGTSTNGRGDIDTFMFDIGTMMYNWYPIKDYTLDDVWAIHDRYGFPKNKLYAMGFSRVGCAPCIFARKDEIAKHSEIIPEHIDIIRQAEEQRNFPYFSPSGKPKQYMNRVSNKGKPYANIDAIIEWAKTDRKDHKYKKFERSDDYTTCSEGLCE